MTRKQRLKADSNRSGGRTSMAVPPSTAVPSPAATTELTETWHPQLIITLTPDRLSLQAELPGLNGARRKVQLSKVGFEADCRRMLQAMADRQCQIGLDGAPTQAQVQHWDHHSAQAPKDGCQFCLEAGWIHATRKPRHSNLHFVGDGSVQVRRLQVKGKQWQRRQQRLLPSLAELGL